MRTCLPSPVMPVTVLLLVALAACGGPLEGPASDPPEPPPAAPPPVSDQRQLSGPSGPVTVAPWATVPLTVTLTELGQPVAEAAVDFALAAEAAPHRLSALRAVTDAAGEASVQVVAAGPPAAFTVTALAAGAAAVQVPVTVTTPSPTVGTLEVALEPPASTVPDALLVSLYDGGTLPCADGAEASATPLQTRALDGAARTARFATVDAGRPWTLVALARRFGVDVARGCVDAVAVPGGATATVTVTLAPLPPDVEGRWRLSHVLELPQGLLPPAEEVAQVLDEAFDAPDDPARWLVERIEDEAALSLGAYRAPAIARVAAFLDETVPPEGLGLSGHLRRAALDHVSVTVEAEAEILPGPCGGKRVVQRWSEVAFGVAGCPECPPRRIPLAGWPTPESEHPVGGDPFHLEIPEHVSAFPVGPLADLFVRRAVWPGLAAGATDTRTLLLGLVGCREVGEAIAAADGFDDGRLGIGVHLADAATLAFACEAALDGLADRADAVLARQAHTLFPPLTSRGEGRWVRSDTPAAGPDRVVGGAWCGSLSAPWGEEALCGTFEGARID